MRSVRLSKALSSGKVMSRTGRTVVGQVLLKFRASNVADRIIMPYPLQDQASPDSYINLSRMYSSEQLTASNLEDLVLKGDLELGS